MIASGEEIGAPDRLLEENVAGEDRVLVGDREGHVAWAVAGGGEHVDLKAGQVEPLAAVEGVLGLIGLERAEARPGDERG